MKNHFIDAMDEPQLRALERIRTKLDSGAFARVVQTCPCGCRPDDALVADQDRYGLPLAFVACRRCGTVRLHPNLSEESWRAFYEQDYTSIKHKSSAQDGLADRQQIFDSEKKEALRIFSSPHVDLLLGRSGTQRPRMLDVGCGHGGMIEYAVEKGFEGAGCDYETDAVHFAKSKGLSVRFGGLEAFGPAEGRFDLVVLSHVLEHVFDPHTFLSQLAALMNPGALLYVELPGLRGVTFARYRGNFLRYLRMFHPFNFDLGALSKVAARSGLMLVDGDEWIHAWFRNSGVVPAPGRDGNTVSYIRWLRAKRWLYPGWRLARRLAKGR